MIHALPDVRAQNRYDLILINGGHRREWSARHNARMVHA